MRTKYTIIGIVFTVISLITFASCNSFLDVNSKENIADDDKDMVDPGKFITSTYYMFTNWDYAFSYLGITEIISDNGDKGSSPTDTGGDKDALDKLEYTVSSGSFNAMWRRWYQTIGSSTLAIQNINNILDKNGNNLEQETIDLYKRYIGEAKFLRAVCYFYLVRGWGDVPLQHVDANVRASKEDVYGFIIQDLNEAMTVLPIAYNASDVGRATKGAAHGLLSKVYLYQENWQAAYDAASKVADQSVYGYKLLTDFNIIWRLEGNNSTESLFEIQAKGTAPAHGVQQYSEVQGPRGGTAALGWGFNTPSENLLNAFNSEGDDIRRDATIIFRNTTLWDGRVIGATENAMYNMKAYSSASGGASQGDKNIRYLRLGEIYLILAEAANELGKTSEALQALNVIRNRVNLPNVTLTDKDALRRKIWNERRLELAMEHDRWFDLIRTGQAKEAMAANGKKFIEGKQELFPIPYLQLQEVPTMGQNPGWN